MRIGFALLTLVSLSCLAGDTQPPLENVVGDAQMGMQIFNDRDRGHCVLCHRVSNNPAPFQGNIGIPLDGIATRLTAGQLRYRIIDSSRLNPEIVMPAYHKTDGLRRCNRAIGINPS